ncbi:ABC transporter ATP-binding protein [Mycoplasmopsis agalactiae]|uniref:ATP-binding cassette domain-containing protein n=1 Tax=Mycoplasmopsis agalactiae TaxID=2110 RepID=UPI00211C6E97|nr:ABC transporter ATP-binding protein [Mycoplasmopsis agalactiae]UUM25761.1 ABC transporter ATP-binding protein [Mycoplasmopsis agalactiae]
MTLEKKNKKENLIEINDLVFKYHKKQKGESIRIDKLEIPKNQIIALLGPSGSGKTTLLNLLLGFLKPTQGTINIEHNPKIHEISYIMQENSIYENVSVFNNVFLSAKNYEKWVDNARLTFFNEYFASINNPELSSKYEPYLEKIFKSKSSSWAKKFKFFALVMKLLFDKKIKNKFSFFKSMKLKTLFKKEFEVVANKIGIGDYIYKNVNELSGGQKQRVAFAKGIIKKTNLVLMDEPFSALDAKIKESTIEWLINIKKEFNLSIIVVTHDQQDALKISDSIILMDNGAIQQFSSGADMYEDPNNLFVAKFIGSPEINYINTVDDISYYIRHNKLSVKKDPNGNFIIVDKKDFGDKIHYSAKFDDKSWSLVTKDSSIEVGQKVYVSYKDADVLAFDKDGNRVRNF